MLQSMDKNIRQYLLITCNYWLFTLTDGALRMLVVLYFHEIGYSAITIAFLFLFYEFFGVITNLIGGWLASRFGLNITMNIGLFLQIVSLVMLVPTEFLSIPWVMSAQALSGIAKDLNKMSAKSGVKLLVNSDNDHRLFHWVAVLTGSKNSLKGIGFFLGALLLSTVGFQLSMLFMATVLSLTWLFSLFLLEGGFGKTAFKPKFSELFAKSRSINVLSAARLLLFASRDVWFVVAIPVYFSDILGWEHWTTGSFMAVWVILYGVVQSLGPKIIDGEKLNNHQNTTLTWLFILLLVPSMLAVGLYYSSHWMILVVGLLIYAIIFAINSSLHSFLIVRFASREGVSLDVGFYYMANALGRLIGTILSGVVYVSEGLFACLLVSSIMLVGAFIVSFALPKPGSSSQ